MRMMLKCEMSMEKANELARKGELEKTIQAILEEQKPEAAYFMASGGKRTALLFVDLKNASEIPKYAEPWFLALDASVEVQPVMVAADLKKAGPSIAKVVKQFG